MSVVLIFTNYDSFLGIDDEIQDSAQWQDDYPDEDHPVAKCVFRKSKSALLETGVDVDACLQDGVYLVYDKLDRSLFEQLKNRTEAVASDVLVHTKGYYHVNDIPSAGKRKTHFGMHKPGGKYYYTPVFKILTDGLGDELERISALFNPPLDAVLRFLNECLKPGNAGSQQLEDARKKILTDAEGDGTVCKAVNDFYDKYKKQTALADYENDLIVVRDILIDFATRK